MSGMSEVIISVPHFKKAPHETVDHEHPYDAAAGNLADHIKFSLTKCLADVKIRRGDVPRSEMDLNRRESRDSDWRKKTREDVEKGKTLLVDVHSFGKSSKFAEFDVVVMDKSDSEEKDLQDEIVDNLKKMGYKVGKYRADPLINDIYRDIVTEQGARDGVLIEMNEDLKEKSPQIAALIGQGVCNSFKKYYKEHPPLIMVE